MDELYKTYGELMIQAEITQGRINEVKLKIAKAIQSAEKSEEVKKSK